MPLFGQILAALYQADIVEEDDIRKWHLLSESKGEDRKPGVETENYKKCWVIGSHMIKQFDAQGSESEEESEEEVEEREEVENVDETLKERPQISQEDAEDEGTTETGSEMETETETESEKETEEDTHTRRRNTIVASGPPALAIASQRGSTAEVQNAESSSIKAPGSVEDSESEADSELTDSTEAGDAGVSASDDSGTNTNTEDEESEDD